MKAESIYLSLLFKSKFAGDLSSLIILQQFYAKLMVISTIEANTTKKE